MQRCVTTIAVTAALLMGCSAVPEYNYKPAAGFVSGPQVGRIEEVGVGDEILYAAPVVRAEALYVPKTMSVYFGAYTITSGYFRKIGTGADGEFFAPTPAADSGRITPVTFAEAAQALYIAHNGELCISTATSIGACGGTTSGFERRTYEEPSQGPRQAIIYNGRIGDRIVLRYREGANAGAQPAFSNTAEYDLSQTREVVYRGARIEVIEATPLALKYRVLRGLDRSSN